MATFAILFVVVNGNKLNLEAYSVHKRQLVNIEGFTVHDMPAHHTSRFKVERQFVLYFLR